MIVALISDAFFFLALFFEALAALDLLQAASAIALPEGFEPIFEFYHARALPIIAVGARLYPATTPAWFPDAYVIALVFFFLFFIKQAYRAAEPYPETGKTRKAERFSPADAAIDAMLPSLMCAIGAVIAAATLLPLLTPLPAAWLASRTLAGRSSWFELSRSYYVNIFLLAAIVSSVYLWAAHS